MMPALYINHIQPQHAQADFSLYTSDNANDWMDLPDLPTPTNEINDDFFFF